MDKIVNLTDRIESEKQKQKLVQFHGKVEAIQKVTQCVSCHFRCASCGQYLHEIEEAQSSSLSGHGYILCEGCKGEFEDFLSLSRNEKHSGLFWHNKEWKEMWSAWASYQEAIKDYIDSPEYKLLLKEMNIKG